MTAPRTRLLPALLLLGSLATVAGCADRQPWERAPGPRAGAQGAEKVLVCHRGRTLEIARPALDAHLRHGDYRGRCR